MKPSEVLKGRVLSEISAQMNQASDEVIGYREVLARAYEKAKAAKTEYEETLKAIEELESKGL